MLALHCPPPALPGPPSTTPAPFNPGGAWGVPYSRALQLQGSGSLAFDNDTLSKVLSYQDSAGAWHQLWFDDEDTLRPKYALASAAGLLGVSAWAANYLPYGDLWLAPRAAAMWIAVSDFYFAGSVSATMTPSPSPLPTSTNGQCGAVWGHCPPGLCCSLYGFCGIGEVRARR